MLRFPLHTQVLQKLVSNKFSYENRSESILCKKYRRTMSNSSSVIDNNTLVSTYYVSETVLSPF